MEFKSLKNIETRSVRWLPAMRFGVPIGLPNGKGRRSMCLTMGSP